jgi:hypothetical protein
MPKIKPMVARTAEDLAEALGLEAAAAKESQVQYAFVKFRRGHSARERRVPIASGATFASSGGSRGFRSRR